MAAHTHTHTVKKDEIINLKGSSRAEDWLCSLFVFTRPRDKRKVMHAMLRTKLTSHIQCEHELEGPLG